MEVSNQIATGKQLTFSEVMNMPGYQASLKNAITDEKRRNRFITSVIAAVSNNPILAAQCEPSTIISAALQGESLGLSPSPTLGEFYIVPYKNKAAFQIGVNGLKQLAMRTGLYRDLDAIEIREGEYKGRDKETGKPTFEFIEDDDVRENLPIIGYLAYYELLNGFKRRVYFSEEKVVNWADRYSPSFKKSTWLLYRDGKITNPAEKAKLDGIHWYYNHTAMGLKTVMRQLLKDAPKSIEMNEALIREAEDENTFNASKTADDVLFGGDMFNVSAQGEQSEIVDLKPKADENESADKKPATRRGRKAVDAELFGE